MIISLIMFWQALNSPVIYIAPAKPQVVNIDTLINVKSALYSIDSELVRDIVECESGGLITAINHNTNGTTDRGLMQINTVHQTGALDMFNPEDNLEFGLRLMKEQGTRPWNSSKHFWNA